MLGLLLLPLALIGAEASAASADYQISLEGSSLEVGPLAPGRLTLSIETRPGKKLNLKAPFELTFSGEGVGLDETRLGPEDAAVHTSSVTLAIGFRGARPGPARVNVRAKFFICDERVCERRIESRSLDVMVRAEGRSG